MRNETRVGVVVGLLVVVVTSVYFYGSSREDEDVLVGLGRRGGVQPGSVGTGAAMNAPAPTVAPVKPAADAGRTVQSPTAPTLFATGSTPKLPTAEPAIAPPKPDESLLADAMRPRRNELPPLTPSPVPLPTGSSSALDDATRRNLEPDAASKDIAKTPSMLDLDSIGERIRRNETAAAAAASGATPPATPNNNGLTQQPVRRPITAVDIEASGDPTANAVPPDSRAGWPKQHRVEYGETLYGIAVQYYGRSSGTAAILKANPSLKGPRSLREGQTLVIPALDDTVAAAAPGPGRGTAPQPVAVTPGRTTYVVRDGDSFYTIASRLLNDGKRWEEIYEMNKVLVKGSPKRLKPGMTIVVPARK